METEWQWQRQPSPKWKRPRPGMDRCQDRAVIGIAIELPSNCRRNHNQNHPPSSHPFLCHPLCSFLYLLIFHFLFLLTPPLSWNHPGLASHPSRLIRPFGRRKCCPSPLPKLSPQTETTSITGLCSHQISSFFLFLSFSLSATIPSLLVGPHLARSQPPPVAVI